MRQILAILLPFLAAFLVYAGYLRLARRRAQASGTPEPPPWYEGPWLWALVGGLLLLFAGLVYMKASSGVQPGVKIESPKWVDQEIVPSQPVERPAP